VIPLTLFYDEDDKKYLEKEVNTFPNLDGN
jgi:hypothetical protein